MIELTKELFLGLCNNILKYHEKVELDGDYPDIIEQALYDLSQKYPELKQIYYIQTTTITHKPRRFLWKYKAWLTDQERRKKILEDRALYDEVLEERKRTFREICVSICDMLGLEPEMKDSDMIKKVAEKAMKNKKQSSGELLGIDFDKVRELPAKHIVLDEDGDEDYTV